MDWFRWYHGSVNDPKFQLVARKSGASVAEVVAVWACLLEVASSSEDRGSLGMIDFEAFDCSLGLGDGLAKQIHDEMLTRGLIVANHVANFAKRQPKREDHSTDRVRAHRDKQKQTLSDAETACNAVKRTETLEEIREEKKTLAPSAGFEDFWSAYPKKRNRGDAEKAWKQIRPSTELLAKMLAALAVAVQRPDWQKEGGQFIPYGGKWLRAKCWEDEGEEGPRTSDATMGAI